MRARRTVIALLAAGGLMLTIASPVAAKGKPPKPPENPPALMDVTLTGALATTCDDGDGVAGAMVMERDGDGLSPVVPMALLDLDNPAVDSSRTYHPEDYPEPPDPSIGFSGCHGEQLNGTTSPYGGLFITLDDSGAVTDLLWHFDYYLATTTRGKREVMSLMEHFTLSAHDLVWDPETSAASGWFNVLYHLEDRANRVSVGYEPVPGSPVFLAFTLTMTPHG